jgi:hypothetical protein
VSTSTGVPGWLWWLLAAILIAVAVAIPFLLGARRRGAWTEKMAAASAEAAWFARVLIPQLQQQPSAEQVAGGWRVARDRVAAAEDSLTGLESTAPGETEAARARTLRDAVRGSKDRLDALVQSAEPSAASAELATAASAVEEALTSTSTDQPPSAQP